MRQFLVAAGQMGPVEADTPRSEVVQRMLILLREAKSASVQHVVFPELSLTTYFARDFHGDRSAVARYFEKSLPSEDTRELFEFARNNRIGFVLGYAEGSSDGSRFNSAALVNEHGVLVGNYRKVHIPGTQEFDPERVWQQLEKRYFTPGDLGFPVWDVQGMKMGMAICNDRRWPESLRVLGLKGVDLVSIGYCTPVFNTQFPDKESAELRQFQSDLTMQAGAYHNSCFVVAAAKAGIEGGCAFQGGSLVVAPSGEILARASSTADELVVAQIDLDQCDFYRNGVMKRSQRRVDAYRLICEDLKA
jgi:predicted amidohydrolase